MPNFSYRDCRYEPVRTPAKNPLTRKITVEHKVRLPDGSFTIAPFSPRFLADLTLFQEWVNLTLLPFYEVDGWRYEPARVTPWHRVTPRDRVTYWDRMAAPTYRHTVCAPDGTKTVFPYVATSLVPENLFKEWLRWHRPEARVFGRRNLSLTLFHRLGRLATEHGIGRDQHDLLAVFEKLTAHRSNTQ